MRCLATVMLGMLVLLILVPAIMQAVATETATRHASVAYVGTYDAAGSPSVAQLPLPSSTDDLIAIAVYAVIGMVLLGLILIGAFVVALLRRQPLARSRRLRGQMEVEETRIMQEIYRSLGKMESRIESLETLLLERTGTYEYAGSARHRVRTP